jgi:arabinan endo-1,5-alpha-L-arabinosidase
LFREYVDMLRLAAFLLPLCLATAVFSAETQPVLTGDLRIHDPSVIVVDGAWVAFGTGGPGLSRGAIRIKTSTDGLAWQDAGSIGRGIPDWVMPTLGYKSNDLWAPSVSMHGGIVYLYYSASSFGVNTSAIALTTNDHFDPRKPAEGWVDHGPVLKTITTDDYNAIDAFRIDTADGRAFLSFGSFWSGIKMRELDPVSGMLKADNPQLYDIAARGRGAIEASSVLHHGDFYYLFVSYDRCCAGIASTYRIMVGRSASVFGPYESKDGKPMLASGATEVEKSSGRFIGPGGQEAFTGPDGAPWLAYHYYDGTDAGVSKLQVAPIRWDADGWPYLDPLPLASAN